MQRTRALLTESKVSVFVVFAVKVLGAGFAFLFNILLARLLGPVGTGIYFLAITVLSIGSTLSRLGLDNAVLRFGAVAWKRNDESELIGLYQRSMALVLLTGMVIAFLIWMLVPHLSLGGRNLSELELVMPFMLLVLAPLSFAFLQGEFLKAIAAPGSAVMVQALLMPMFLLMGAGALYWRGHATIEQFAFLYLAAVLMTVLVSIAVWGHYVPQFWKVKGYFSIRKLLQVSFPLLWVSTLSLMMGWTDILVLGVWKGSAEVGIYGVASRIAVLSSFILVSVNSVIAPRFASLHAQRNYTELARLAQRGALWMFLSALPLIFFLLIFSNWVLSFFGDSFESGALILRILIIGQLINLATGSVGYLLMMTGNERLMRNNIAIWSILNLFGNLMLVPPFGAVGAAISTSVSMAGMSLVSFLLVRSSLNINTLAYFSRKE